MGPRKRSPPDDGQGAKRPLRLFHCEVDIVSSQNPNVIFLLQFSPLCFILPFPSLWCYTWIQGKYLHVHIKFLQLALSRSHIMQHPCWSTIEGIMKILGGTHILRHTGMCCNFGSFFWKKFLNMGPIFHEKIPKYGSDFQNFPENLEKKKLLKMGTFFLKNP